MTQAGKIKDYKKATRIKKCKKIRAAAKKSIVIRETSNEHLNIPAPYQYVLYFAIKTNYRTRVAQAAAVLDFSKYGFSGKWKICYDQLRKRDTLITRLLLEEESDMIMLRLCHNLQLHRILKITR